ncbi:MAG: AraC family transcriptional regulator [Gammaproteobacteria bacterium]|jgi:AraC family transcriptional regulator
MKILIKNMVCDRCKLVIQNVLDELRLKPQAVYLGEVDFGEETIEAEMLEQFQQKITPLGFELINNRKSRVIENIKKHVIALVQNPQPADKVKLSEHLSHQLHHDYTHLSNLFSTVEGVTIEQYFINQKIEKTRELLVYDELTLTEISYRLGYSSVAHLSRQFKKVTGMTPSEFKRLHGSNQRQSLDKV